MAERKKVLFAQDEAQRASLEVHSNPMPSHSAPPSVGEINMVQINDEVDEEIMNWVDESPLIKWHGDTSEGPNSSRQIVTHEAYFPKLLVRAASARPLIRPYSAIPLPVLSKPLLYNRLSLRSLKFHKPDSAPSMPGSNRLLNKLPHNVRCKLLCPDPLNRPLQPPTKFPQMHCPKTSIFLNI